MSDLFLNVSGIQGECTEREHPRWIAVLDAIWSVEQVSAGQRGRMHPHFEPLKVWKELDKSSPLLALACAQGRRLKEVALEFTGNFQVRDQGAIGPGDETKNEKQSSDNENRTCSVAG